MKLKHEFSLVVFANYKSSNDVVGITSFYGRCFQGMQPFYINIIDGGEGLQ